MIDAREINVIEAAGRHPRLTITPTRITVKVVHEDASGPETPELLNFAKLVGLQMIDVTNSWRGKVRVSEHSLGVELQTDGRKQCKKFYIARSELNDVVSNT